MSQPTRMSSDEMRNHSSNIFSHYKKAEDEPNTDLKDEAVSMILQHYHYHGKGKLKDDDEDMVTA